MFDPAIFEKSEFVQRTIREGHATLPQLESAMRQSQQTGIHFIYVLEKTVGKKFPPEIVRLYRDLERRQQPQSHSQSEAERKPLTEFDIPAIKQMLRSRLIPHNICREYRLFPLKQTQQSILVGMVAPDNPEAIRALEMCAKRAHRTFERCCISEADYNRLMTNVLQQLLADNQYQMDARAFAPGKTYFIGTLDGEKVYMRSDDIDREPISLDKPTTDKPAAAKPANAAASPSVNVRTSEYTRNLADPPTSETSPTVALVDRLLAEAVRSEATSILLEPQADALRIRLNLGGMFQDFLPTPRQPIPRSMGRALVDRFRTIANLDLRDRNTAQKAIVRLTWGDRKIDVRLQIMPTAYGESLFLQFL